MPDLPTAIFLSESYNNSEYYHQSVEAAYDKSCVTILFWKYEEVTNEKIPLFAISKATMEAFMKEYVNAQS